jgi:lipoate-protein ligase A
MAADQALLDAVDRDPRSAVIRTYAWLEPTLSLGYFQKFVDAEADRRWQGVPIVRRPSGGGALWHDRELTYAVAVPRSHRLARRPADLYRAIHQALADWLHAQGWPATRRSLDPDGDRSTTALSPDRPFLCFLDRDSEDVVVRGCKIAGSAQRRRPGAVLQHGSLLRERSPRTPELPGLADVGAAVRLGSLETWARELPAVLAAALELPQQPGEWAGDVLEEVRESIKRQFAHPTWTRKR